MLYCESYENTTLVQIFGVKSTQHYRHNIPSMVAAENEAHPSSSNNTRRADNATHISSSIHKDLQNVFLMDETNHEYNNVTTDDRYFRSLCTAMED